ncbi:MAG: hypothetical protein US50_C0043G0001 [Candidatus Nomurabacteria bacterium GW2011_GWB1_37_5]|uniref:DUF5673 domain-containing protein n=1 Tax=Candidatus Nomurabacteria bacterium GW2011_GWB1_37_5 TaxID=1618742 RepID=A0A0G0JCR1_9BACT|nr:MAG: hypothetical protein US50_C0043G0001 [Candidatus Nomurabacteria bacterium GW2011_GWB1_37_5]
MNEEQTEEKNILKWQAPAYDFKEKTADWLWAIVIIAICGSIASIIFKNFLFAIFIIIGAFLLIIFNFRKPELVDYLIDEHGIKIKDTRYRYRDLTSFWVDAHKNKKRVYVQCSNFLSPELILPIDDLDEDIVRNILNDHVEEVEVKEPLSHKVMDYFGF